MIETETLVVYGQGIRETGWGDEDVLTIGWVVGYTVECICQNLSNTTVKIVMQITS